MPRAISLTMKTPRWALPLLEPKSLKAVSGGRASGKSHFFAEQAVERSLCDPHFSMVCIREVQKSLKFSAKKLIEDKIRHYGLQSEFEITQTEIRRVGGTGVFIFQGMQDHTADSIKSLEGFDVAWVEEAQSLSQKSIDLLLPTIRGDGSEIWFSYNPYLPTDAISKLVAEGGDDLIHVHVNYDQNPFLPEKMRKLAAKVRENDYDKYRHVWRGEFNLKSESKVFAGKYKVKDFTPATDWDGPYQGVDFGFAQDPTTMVRCWVHDNKLYIEYEAGAVGVELDHTLGLFKHVPEFDKYATRADSARPESISYLKRHGFPKLEGVKKWQGSVQDGVEHIRNYDCVIIHSRCKKTAEEFSLYSYKENKAGDILPDIVDEHNHFIDAVRYALQPLIQAKPKPQVIFLDV